MRRWMMLALGTAAQTVAGVFLYGVPYLSDMLRRGSGLSLAQVGLVVACPTAGLVLTLVAWGAVADRYGERKVIASGLTAAGLLLGLATQMRGLVPLGAVLAAAGAASASVSAASGRLVLGWFSAEQRGLAMGIRQTATPLGMGIAALTVPPLAEYGGVPAPVLGMAVLCAAVALLVGVCAADPPPPPAGQAPEKGRKANPYRRPDLWRVHASSALLCIPQFTAGVFALVFLVDVRGWSAVHAGQLLACAQVLGAASRILAGRWSDRVGSRLRPMRLLACATGVVMGLTGLGALWPSPATDLLLIIACGITASTNGLAFTATAELAGRAWSGRAMGVQNTGQNLAAALTPPALGVLITGAGYAWGFAVAAALAVTAAFVVPVTSERTFRHRAGGDEGVAAARSDRPA